MPVKTLDFFPDHFSTQTQTQYVHILDKIANSKSKLFFCLLYLLPAGCRIGHHMRGTGTKWHFNVMPLYLHTGYIWQNIYKHHLDCRKCPNELSRKLSQKLEGAHKCVKIRVVHKLRLQEEVGRWSKNAYIRQQS